LEEQQEITTAERLRMHDAYCHIFTDLPQGIDVLAHLSALYGHEFHPIHSRGATHADTSFVLGQRSVIAYIKEVLSKTSAEIQGEHQQVKAEGEK